MYEVSYDAADHVLHIRLSGFWTRVTIAQFTATLVLKTTWLRLRRSDYAVLSDSREFDVQTPEVAAALDHLMRRGIEMGSGATAVVVGSMLNKIQAERTLTGDRVRVFLDMDHARAWLASQREVRQAA